MPHGERRSPRNAYIERYRWSRPGLRRLRVVVLSPERKTRMPRFFFNYRDGIECLDEEGVELAGIVEARALALQSSGEAIQELGSEFWQSPEWHTWVTDESGATVCSLRFLVGKADTDCEASRSPAA